MDPNPFSWYRFLLLSVLAITALVFALPRPIKPIRWIAAMSILIFMIGFGMLLAEADGIQVSVLSKRVAGQNLTQLLIWLGLVLGVGAIVGVSLLIIINLLSKEALPQLRARFTKEKDIPTWKRWIIAAYSGILEEIIFRLFLLSLIGWVVGLAWHGGSGQPTIGALWVSNIVAAAGFGIAHLPRWSAVTKPSTRLRFSVLVMNGLGGLAFGYLFITQGIEAAILAHFIGDAVLHVIGLKYLSR